MKIIAVAKVTANIAIHICSSIAWQAGARPVSQPPAPGLSSSRWTGPLPVIGQHARNTGDKRDIFSPSPGGLGRSGPRPVPSKHAHGKGRIHLTLSRPKTNASVFEDQSTAQPASCRAMACARRTALGRAEDLKPHIDGQTNLLTAIEQATTSSVKGYESMLRLPDFSVVVWLRKTDEFAVLKLSCRALR